MLTIRAIYRLRAYLGAAIERWGEASGPGLARYLPWHAFSSVGHHVLAAWVALVYLAWAVGSSGAALLLTQGLLATLLALDRRQGGQSLAGLDAGRGRSSGSTAGDEGTAELEPLPTAQVLGITAIRVGVMVLGLLSSPRHGDRRLRLDRGGESAARSGDHGPDRLHHRGRRQRGATDSARRRPLHRRPGRQRQPALFQPDAHPGEHGPEPRRDDAGCHRYRRGPVRTRRQRQRVVGRCRRGRPRRSASAPRRWSRI